MKIDTNIKDLDQTDYIKRVAMQVLIEKFNMRTSHNIPRKWFINKDDKIRVNIFNTIKISSNKHFTQIGLLRKDLESKNTGLYLGFLKDES